MIAIPRIVDDCVEPIPVAARTATRNSKAAESTLVGPNGACIAVPRWSTVQDSKIAATPRAIGLRGSRQ